MGKKKISFVVLGVVLIFATLVIFFLFKTADLCKSFSPNPNEITCQDAVSVVLEKYPGKITKIDRKTLSIPIPDGIPQPPSKPNLSSSNSPELGSKAIFENKMAWLISVITDQELSFPKNNTTKNLDIAVSVVEKKILIIYPKFEK